MALYLEEFPELAHRPRVSRPMQAVEHAIDARGLELRLDGLGALLVRLFARLADCIFHDPQHRLAVALVSSEIRGEGSSEGGAR